MQCSFRNRRPIFQTWPAPHHSPRSRDAKHHRADKERKEERATLFQVRALHWLDILSFVLPLDICVGLFMSAITVAFVCCCCCYCCCCYLYSYYGHPFALPTYIHPIHTTAFSSSFLHSSPFSYTQPPHPPLPAPPRRAPEGIPRLRDRGRGRRGVQRLLHLMRCRRGWLLNRLNLVVVVDGDHLGRAGLDGGAVFVHIGVRVYTYLMNNQSVATQRGPSPSDQRTGGHRR